MALMANRVRARREECGLSQLMLASRVHLSRQSIGAIEAGRTVPAVDVALRVAQVLECRVEDLFGTAPEPRVTTEPSSLNTSERVALARIAGRWVSYPLVDDAMRFSADGLIGAAEPGSAGPGNSTSGNSESEGRGRGVHRRHRREVAQRQRGSLAVELLRPAAAVRDNVVIMGCAAGLGLLADHLNSRPGPGRFLWLPRSSTAALEALAKRHTHVAGVHLVDPRTGESNVPDVRRLVVNEPVALVTLARWQLGLVLRQEDQRRIRGPADLGRRGLRLVAREAGAGAQRLLEQVLLQAGRPLELAHKPSLCAPGHLEVARAVAIGAADTGIATQDVALGFRLAFIPLAEERYDLAVPVSSLTDPRLQRLFDGLVTAGFRRELSLLGYDVQSAGERVAEVNAA